MSNEVKKTEKISVVITKEERQFLNDCLAFYYSEGSPLSMSSLIKQLCFDRRNAMFLDLEYATGRSKA